MNGLQYNDWKVTKIKKLITFVKKVASYLFDYRPSRCCSETVVAAALYAYCPFDSLRIRLRESMDRLGP